MLMPASRFARPVISGMSIFGPAEAAGWTVAVGTEPACDAAAGFGDVGDCAVWAAALAMPSNRTATKARAISRNRSIIGCPLTGDPLSRRLTVDGVDNKANGRFAGCPAWGVAQPDGIPCLFSSSVRSLPKACRATQAYPLTRPRAARDRAPPRNRPACPWE